MRVIVIGMGEIGKYITSILVRDGHQVTIIDSDAEALQEADEKYDAASLHGQGASLNILKKAHVKNADIVIAVTEIDEVNMLACLTAKKLGAKKAIARTYSRDYVGRNRGFFLNILGIDLVISPKFLAAFEINKLLMHTEGVAVEDFAKKRVRMIRIPIVKNNPVIGKKLREIPFPAGCLIASIVRGNEVIIPKGDSTIRVDDLVMVIGKKEMLGKLEQILGKRKNKVIESVMMVGGGEIGFLVAKHLETVGVKAKIIERKRDRCEHIARHLKKSEVLHGNGTNISLLREENIHSCDVFVTTTNSDEINLLSALIARDLGAKKIVSVVYKPEYAGIYRHLGFSATVNPIQLTANKILKFVKREDVICVSLIADGKGEILEMVAREGSDVVNKPLSDVVFPEHALVAAVVSGDEVIVPKGPDIIRPGNTVIVFTLSESLKEVERLFAGSR